MKLPALLVFLLAPLSLSAATIPYTNNFSGTGSNTAFPTENTDANWTVTGGKYRDVISAGTNSTSTASIPLTNVTGDFSISTQFTVTSIGSYTAGVNSSFSVGFGAFASSSTFSSTGNSFYLADFTYFVGQDGTSVSLGTIRILSQGDSTGFSSTAGTAIASGSATNYAISLNTAYTLRLTGTNSAGTVSMTFGLYDELGQNLIGTAATATDTSLLAGTNFGYRNRTGGTTSTGPTLEMDNFSVSVPEPQMAIPITLALAGMVLFLRRRRGASLPG